MKAESKRLTTADLAQAGAESAPEPVTDRPSAANSGSNGGLLESEMVQSPAASVEERTPGEFAGAAGELPGAAREISVTGGSTASTAAADATTAPLFEQKEADDLHARWNEIQVGFVDAPRTAVEQADSLVAETIKHLAESFAAGRQKLEGEWGRGGDASTETLRVTLQRYRSFFNRLLTI